MSTLEKAIGLLQEMPENKLEAVYMYMRFVNSQADDDYMPAPKTDINSIGNAIADKHKKNNTASMDGLKVLQSFAGTLPENFDYKRELDEAREEKYGHFN